MGWEITSMDNLFRIDPQLPMFEKEIRKRKNNENNAHYKWCSDERKNDEYGLFKKNKMWIENMEGFDRFTRSHRDYGVVVGHDGGVRCQEWIPNAKAVFLKGQFNNSKMIPYNSVGQGKWELFLPPKQDRNCPLPHLTALKLSIETQDHQSIERISPWARYVTQSGSSSKWLFWNPPHNQLSRQISRSHAMKPDRLRIYEAHLGKVSKSSDMSSYRYFTSQVLPRVCKIGYNCVLLMAVTDHPYCSSSDSHADNFFATPSRLGTPNELRELINVAHEMGIYVLMDVMHGLVSENALHGLGLFGWTDECYFRPGWRRRTGESGIRRFDVTKHEVLRFLLSNLRYYLDEFSFDGFKFRGVTSMIFNNIRDADLRTRDWKFGNDYQEYFGMSADLESMSYLMLANQMLHQFYPHVITIAEEHSGFPSICRPVQEGGLGFDYRLNMATPRQWIKFLTEHNSDEEWKLDIICDALSQTRPGEKYIVLPDYYDKNKSRKMALAHFLMGGEPMSEEVPMTPRLERGISLHKMIKLFTNAFAGNGGCLTFMGNEYDWPALGEMSLMNDTPDYECRGRRHQLGGTDGMRFKCLYRFETALNQLERKFGWLNARPVSTQATVFSFEYMKSTPNSFRYKIVLDTDDKMFGGRGRNQSSLEFFSQMHNCDNRSTSIVVSLPSRCAIVMSTDDFRYDGYGCDANQSYLEPNHYKSGFTSEYRTGPRHNEYVQRHNESCVRSGHHHDDSYLTEKECFMHRHEDRYTKECKGERSRECAESSDQFMCEKRCCEDHYCARDHARSSRGVRFNMK